MKKFKHWLIRKLGGLVYSDLSPRLQAHIRRQLERDFSDKVMVNMLNCGYKMEE